MTALRDLARLTSARDALAAAAGDADAVVTAIDALDARFVELTGSEPVRHHGQTYAGRTLVYEDTTRDVRVRFGRPVLDELGPPLSLVLDSGRWLAARIEADCLARLEEHFDRRRSERVPLARLLALATRDFYAESRVPPVAGPAMAELQRRWQRILAVPAGVHHHQVEVTDIAGRCADAFRSAGPGWASGLFHSPDVMIVAGSAEAIDRGEFGFVLGELHAAFNTVESRALVEQSPDRHRLLSMTERVTGGRRVVPVAPRAWGAVTARTSPPSALLSRRFSYWTVGDDDVSDLPGAAMPLAALEVARAPGGLLVQCRGRDVAVPLVEMIGEYLSGATVNAFRMLAPAAHTPRVTIGRLVVSRETWRMPARKCAWAFQLDERKRYLQMREWLTRHGIPRRAFTSVPIETKPTYVDFTSIALVNLLAGTIRRMVRLRPGDDVTISEMLPDPTGLWLADAGGARYTSELRMVAAESPAGPARERTGAC